MRREAVLASILVLFIITVLGVFIFKEFTSEITGYSVLERKSELSCPLADGVITAEWHSRGYKEQFGTSHEGVDFAYNGGNAATCYKEVRAMADGVAYFLPDPYPGQKKGPGNSVEIIHEGGIKTRYLHLYDFAQNEGTQQVRRGHLIGHIGTSGLSTGCHLHFEIVVNPDIRQTVNPLDYVCTQKCGDLWCDAPSAPSLALTNEEKELLKQVDKNTGLSSTYPPDELLASLIGIHNLRAPDKRASRLLVEDLKSLMNDATSAGIDMHILSAYRSYESQVNTFNGYVREELLRAQQAGSPINEEEAKKRANVYSAYPGHSEHQLGTAIDFSTSENKHELDDGFAATNAGIWLSEHAEEYGFVLSYPKGKESLTGYQYEPWHYRYIGKKFAQELVQKDYKGNNQITVNTFIAQKLKEAEAITLSPNTIFDDSLQYDAKIIYSIEPSFKETISYDLSEIESLTKTAREISDCKTDECVKNYHKKEIDGLTWHIGACENSQEEKFNEFSQLVEDCAAQQDNYCRCGNFEAQFEPGYDLKIKKDNGLSVILLHNSKEVISRKIETEIFLNSPATGQKQEITDQSIGKLCTSSPDFCEKGNELEIAKYDSVVINRRFLASSGQPYIRSCGSKRTILIDPAPSQQDYAQQDLAVINTAYRLVNSLKGTDEGLAVTKLSTGIPQGSHADSVNFVQAHTNAQAYVTLVLGEQNGNGFTIQHAKNEKSQRFGQLIKNRLPTSTIEATDFGEPAHFVIKQTRMNEKDIPVIVIKFHGSDTLAQDSAAEALLGAFSEYFNEFGAVSIKKIYPICVKSSHYLTAYDKITGKEENKAVEYKFALKLN